MNPELLRVRFIHLRSYDLVMAAVLVLGTFRQARHSLRRWLGRDVPLEPMLAAVRRSP